MTSVNQSYIWKLLILITLTSISVINECTNTVTQLKIFQDHVEDRKGPAVK